LRSTEETNLEGKSGHAGKSIATIVLNAGREDHFFRAASPAAPAIETFVPLVPFVAKRFGL
jgi:hypothetical protein